MNIDNTTFWEHLAEEMESLMQVSESLINKILSLIEEYNLDVTVLTEWHTLPDVFRNEIKSYIANHIEKMSNIPTLGIILQTDVLYQSVFETLEAQYIRIDKKDISARTLLLHLMEEVMEESVSSGIMELSDWHNLLEKRKEALHVEYAGEYVYKKICNILCPENKMRIYDFFYNNTSSEEIDRLLITTKDYLLFASEQRRQTKKRGQGMSRIIIDCIHQWQNEKLLKPLKSIYPFCQCLQAYWNNEVNLGTRQGLEATYKQRF